MSANPVSCIPGDSETETDQGDLIVGRPKKSAKKAEPMKPKTVGIRSTGEWAAWLEEGAEFCRTDVAKLIDAAVAEYLKKRDFDKPPPKRVPPVK